MITLKEARRIQEKAQNKAILKFLMCALLITALFAVTAKRTDILTTYPAAYLLFVLLLYPAIRYSKIYKMFRKAEVTGKVVYSNVRVETVRKYASNTYGQTDSAVLDIVIEDDKGRLITRQGSYSCKWGEFKKGETVTLLRFWDMPFRDR